MGTTAERPWAPFAPFALLAGILQVGMLAAPPLWLHPAAWAAILLGTLANTAVAAARQYRARDRFSQPDDFLRQWRRSLLCALPYSAWLGGVITPQG